MADTYLVGGAVRDGLLQKLAHHPVAAPSHVDRDWVVVGSTPEAMLAQGYEAVGLDFPVFLHPRTREEYALARTERKSGKGYKGFECIADPTVSLPEDLRRRDLSINAMAVAEADLPAFEAWLTSGADTPFAGLHDPYQGWVDLQAGVLRHVSEAFAEDPVRILRLARFAARWPHFRVADETQALMQSMVASGEVDHLVPERVWQELSRGLMEAKPSRMMAVLHQCGALQVLLPEVAQLHGVPQRADYHPEVDTLVHVNMVLDMAAQMNTPLAVRFACLCHDLGKGTTPADVLPRHIGHEQRSAQLLRRVADHWRVPRDTRELADVVAREHGNIHGSMQFGAGALARLLGRCDAYRRPERFEQVLLACEADARGRLGFEDATYPQAPRLLGALKAGLAVQASPLIADAAAKGVALKGPQVAQAMDAAREAAIEAHLAGEAHPPTAD